MAPPSGPVPTMRAASVRGATAVYTPMPSSPALPFTSSPLAQAAAVPGSKRWVPVNDVGITDAPPKMGSNYQGPIGDNFKERPLLQRLNFLHLGLLTATPLLALYGVCTATWDWRTLAFAVFYYVFSGLGITAGQLRAAVSE